MPQAQGKSLMHPELTGSSLRKLPTDLLGLRPMMLPKEEPITFEEVVNTCRVEIALLFVHDLPATVAVDKLRFAERDQKILLPWQAVGCLRCS